ncbi:MAG: hypothetical protein R2818_11375 [Flavobacteriales bacterium]
MVYLLYHGYVDIAYWEYALGSVYLFILYVYFARQKNIAIKKAPEYRHFLWGLLAKVFGGVAFSLIYFYYYRGGDTVMFFYSAVSMSKMAAMDLPNYFTIMFGDNSAENLTLFNEEIGYPFGYLYFDPRTWFVIRLISPIVILTFNSYLITTIILASLSYIGVWRCYRTFVSYFPSLTDKFAWGFLYMPSVIFWGSGILKDTFTFSATCWWVHCVDEVFFKRRNITANTFGLLLSAVFLIVVKPYIFMVLFPACMLWTLYSRVSRIQSGLIRIVLLPVALAVFVFGSFYVLTKLGSSLDKFSLDKAIQTVQITQSDMSRSEAYGDNYFDVGAIDGTLLGLLSKFPVATNAAMFRPYIWEARSVVVAMSGLENLFLLGLTVFILWRTRFYYFLRFLIGNPLVLMCIAFTVFFAFAIGISTPNFGALVRFKIPMVPFMVSGLFIIDFLNRKRIAAEFRGRPFDLSIYQRGEQGAADHEAAKQERKEKWLRSRAARGGAFGLDRGSVASG